MENSVEKSDDGKNDMRVAFPAGEGVRSSSVLIEASAAGRTSGPARNRNSGIIGSGCFASNRTMYVNLIWKVESL